MAAHKRLHRGDAASLPNLHADRRHRAPLPIDAGPGKRQVHSAEKCLPSLPDLHQKRPLKGGGDLFQSPAAAVKFPALEKPGRLPPASQPKSVRRANSEAVLEPERSCKPSGLFEDIFTRAKERAVERRAEAHGAKLQRGTAGDWQVRPAAHAPLANPTWVPGPNPPRVRPSDEEAKESAAPEVAAELPGRGRDKGRRHAHRRLPPVADVAGAGEPPRPRAPGRAGVGAAEPPREGRVCLERPRVPLDGKEAETHRDSPRRLQPALREPELWEVLAREVLSSEEGAKALAQAPREQLADTLEELPELRLALAPSESFSDAEVAALQVAFKRFRMPHTREMHRDFLVDLAKFVGYPHVVADEVTELAAQVTKYLEMEVEEVQSFLERFARKEYERLRATCAEVAGDGADSIPAGKLEDFFVAVGFVPDRALRAEITVGEALRRDPLFFDFEALLGLVAACQRCQGFRADEVGRLRRIFRRLSPKPPKPAGAAGQGPRQQRRRQAWRGWPSRRGRRTAARWIRRGLSGACIRPPRRWPGTECLGASRGVQSGLRTEGAADGQPANVGGLREFGLEGKEAVDARPGGRSSEGRKPKVESLVRHQRYCGHARSR
mmetsp:Transcript_184275/g.584340  ORF Transcript_184275/g.584340 Transcript_184275/m.584340 type:complete len:610 (+) Transcript_184275:117-1946(+)